MKMDPIIDTTHLPTRALPPWKAIMAAYMEITAVAPKRMIKTKIQLMYRKEAGNMNGPLLRLSGAKKMNTLTGVQRAHIERRNPNRPKNWPEKSSILALPLLSKGSRYMKMFCKIFFSKIIGRRRGCKFFEQSITITINRKHE